jgi:hypothetical protein
MITHYAEVAHLKIARDGTVLNQSQGTIKEHLTRGLEHRILRDPDNPNTNDFPTINEYLAREAADGFVVVQVAQTFIVTTDAVGGGGGTGPTGPAGPDGADGADGPTGPTGPTGSSAAAPRIQTAPDATSITPALDTADLVIQTNTQAAGTLTLNAPTGVFVEGQGFSVRVKCTNSQTWSFNAIYRSGTDVSLPTSTTAGKDDYLGFKYNSAAVKFDCVGLARGY